MSLLYKKCRIILLILVYFVNSIKLQELSLNDVDNIDFDVISDLTEIPGSKILGEKVLSANESPYLLRTDLEIERGGKLIIQPGVVINFAPMVGITIRGTIVAVVSNFILLNSSICCNIDIKIKSTCFL